jgi:hypothetical protein
MGVQPPTAWSAAGAVGPTSPRPDRVASLRKTAPVPSESAMTQG